MGIFFKSLFGAIADIYYEDGLELFDRKKYDEALIKLNKALTKNPQHPDSLALMGEIYSRKDKYSQAIEYFLKAEPLIKGKEKTVALYYMLGCTYTLADQQDKAIEAFKKLDDQVRGSSLCAS